MILLIYHKKYNIKQNLIINYANKVKNETDLLNY